jgi:ATP-dependent helicase/nuclease subunit A
MIAPSAAASLGRTSPEGFWAKMGENEEKGATFGLAFHEVMENVDWPAGRNLRELCLLKAKEYGITDRVAELVSLSAKCLAHPLGERIRRAQRLFREVPFAVILDEKIVEGKIDLLLAENNDWVIIDYKTDKIRKEDLASRVTLYREQGVYYARAMQQITGRKVKEVIFFFVRLGELATLTDWA